MKKLLILSFIALLTGCFQMPEIVESHNQKKEVAKSFLLEELDSFGLKDDEVVFYYSSSNKITEVKSDKGVIYILNDSDNIAQYD